MKSMEEAIDWALKALNPHGEGGETYIEVRQFFELEDFGESQAINDARKLGKRLTAQQGKK